MITIQLKVTILKRENSNTCKKEEANKTLEEHPCTQIKAKTSCQLSRSTLIGSMSLLKSILRQSKSVWSLLNEQSSSSYIMRITSTETRDQRETIIRIWTSLRIKSSKSSTNTDIICSANTIEASRLMRKAGTLLLLKMFPSTCQTRWLAYSGKVLWSLWTASLVLEEI